MKKLLVLFGILSISVIVQAQIAFDSLTISRFLISEEMYGANWRDTLKTGQFPGHITNEKTVWVKPQKVPKVLPSIISITNRIKSNGTADVAKCFIPRHSINYYKQGRIVKYLLICFECDGLRFSDDPPGTFVKSVGTREKQMAELKMLFADLIKPD